VSASRTALVTGAGSGIGRATSLALAEAGFAVVLAGRSLAPLEALAADIALLGATALPVTCDVSSPTDVIALFGKLEATFGRLDLMFNNAGVGNPIAEIEDVSYEDWRRVLDTNVTGSFLCTQQAIRLMKSQRPRGGRIINNGSVSARAPRPRYCPYTVSKHAITGLTKQTALDGRAYDIACGQIDLGVVATEAAQWVSGAPAPQANGTMAVEAAIDPGDVANTVRFMAELPLDSNVLFLTLMPTKMPLVGRG
jgi:NAD(P)-dependent dehydrogenase (short-subunit alcohol dehydrogenase family)